MARNLGDEVKAALEASKGMGVSSIPFTHKNCYLDFLTENALNANPATVEVWLFTTLCFKPGFEELEHAYVKTDGHKAKFKLTDEKYPADFKSYDVIDEKVCNLVKGQSQGAKTRFFELVGCYQVKAMVEKNFINYYASKSMELDVTRIIQVVRFASYALPRITDKVKDLAKESVFVKYHTAGFSTPHLLERMKSALGEDIKTVFKFSEDDMKKMNECIDNSDDPLLPAKLTSKVKDLLIVFLRSYKIFPDKYYFGIKHEDSMNPAMKSKLNAIMNRYRDIQINVGDISNATKEGLSQLIT
jgi:hypothetical protein